MRKTRLLGGVPRHRAKAIALVLVAICALVGACALSGRLHALRQLAETAGAQDSEEMAAGQVTDELAGLVFPLDGFEVVAVSADRRVVGLACAESVAQVSMEVDQGMRERGWTALAGGGGQVLTFGRAPGEGCSGELSDVTYALVVIERLSDETSVLVQLG